jgi:hypothetical protein
MTIIVRHDCVENGPNTPGSALDCDPCRTSLEWKAFPEGPDLAKMIVHGSRLQPSPSMPDDEEISREVSPDLALQDPDAFHLTTPKIHHFKTKQGGMWFVTCTCGWSRSGRFARDEGETTALRLATLRGSEHEDNPDKRCAYCGNPHRLSSCTFCRHDNRHGNG